MTTYDTIGTIYKPTGVILTDSEGFEYPEMEVVEGYHVNVLDAPDTVSPYVVQVNTPSMVFAGRTDTVHLKFTDRAEWLSLGLEIVEEGI